MADVLWKTIRGRVVPIRGGVEMPRVLRVLRYVLVLYPLLWMLGIDGLAWILVLAMGIVEVHRIRAAPGFLLGVVVFVLSAVLAVFQIQSAFRLLTWAWDLGVILTGLMVILAASRIDGREFEKQLLVPVANVIAFSVISGVISLLLHNDFAFHTPLYYVLPSSISSTDFGQALTVKRMYHESWFAGFDYSRLKSTFVFATSFAAALAGFLVFYATWWKRLPLIYFAVAIGAVACLLFTTARTSIAATIMGVGVLVALRRETLTLVAVVLFAGLGLVFWAGNTGFAVDSASDVAQMRGGGSVRTRTEIYSRTAAAIVANPLGHGSQVDVPDLNYPLGSHSSLLGVAFKFGVVGFSGVLIALGTLVWRSVRRGTSALRKVAPLAIALFAISLFEELYLDSMTALFLATLFGGVLGDSRKSASP